MVASECGYEFVSEIFGHVVSCQISALVKGDGPILAGTPLAHQVQLLNIPNPNSGANVPDISASYDLISRLVTMALSPYFDYLTFLDPAAGSSSTSVALARKKFSELTLTLQQLHQRIRVPELMASASPSVVAVLELPDSAEDPSVLSDTALLNDLTKTVNGWIRQVQSVTSIQRNSSESSTIQDEVLFWKSMESALESVLEQVAQPQVKRAIEILNAAKRFQVTLAFQNNLGITEKLDETKAYNVLLKDLPISDLIYSKENALDLASIEHSITSLFNHLKRWKSQNTFPLERMIELIELLIKEIVSSLTHILAEMNLMIIPFASFVDICEKQIIHVLDTIDSNVKFMVNIIRELMRKRQEKFMIVKIDQQILSELRDRIDHLLSLRGKHQDLLHALMYLDENGNLMEEITASYSKHVAINNLFDFSKPGASVLQVNEQLYYETSSKILNSISSMVNAKLLYCETFADFVAYFMKFQESTSTVSPLIFSFVDESHKLRLLEIVYADIQMVFKSAHLIRKDSTQFPQSSGSFNSSLSPIIWDLSIKNRLEFVLETLLNIIGENWSKYSVGSNIEQETRSFIKKMDIDAFFQNWVSNATKAVENDTNQLPVLRIDYPDVVDGNKKPKVVVNFDHTIIEFMDQAQELQNLGFEIPMNLSLQLEKIRSAHPLVLSLQEHLDTLEEILTVFLIDLEEGKKLGFMLESQKKIVIDLIPQIMNIQWSVLYQEISIFESESVLDQISTQDLQLTNVKMLQDEIDKLHYMCNQIQRSYHIFESVHYANLIECEFLEVVISETIKTIQDEVYSVAKSSYHNLDSFVDLVNEDVMSILSQKCSKRLQAITNEILEDSENEASVVPVSSHHITFANHEFTIVPPLEKTKLSWIKLVNDTFHALANQNAVTLYSSNSKLIIQESPFLIENIELVMDAIDSQYLSAVDNYGRWSQVQSMLAIDLNVEDFYKDLDNSDEDDLGQWLGFVRKVIDSSHLVHDSNTVHSIGKRLEISFTGIQSRAISAFDAFYGRVLEKFMQFVQKNTSLLLKELVSAQKLLSSQFRLDTDAAGAVQNVDLLCSYIQKVKIWQALVDRISTCQALLQRRRVSLSPDWIYVEQLESKIANVNTLIESCEHKINDLIDVLRLGIQSESERCQGVIKELISEWKKRKPITAHLLPNEALSTLAVFQARCSDTKDKLFSIERVATFLKLKIDIDTDIDIITAEIKDLKFVWNALLSLWKSLDDIKAQKWSEAHSRTLKSQLEDILVQCRATPVIVRQYSAFEEIQKKVKHYLNEYPSISELKNSSLKERHWAQIFTFINYEKQKSLESIVVGDILNINFSLYELMIKNIISQANSEQIVEESLEEIKKEWSRIVFETFNFEKKCRLVKNWSFLFEQCDSNLNTLSNMKSSTFHGPYEAERADLEDKINSLLVLFNLWIEVQKQWSYLYGVFDNCKEIQFSLPVEFTRFSNTSFEFISFMKRIGKLNTVMDILSYNDVHSLMAKISETLNKTRKGLTDFLEKQRDRFPRLCFIGNDDLLELIGNGGSVSASSRHLKQMFSGIASVEFDTNSSSIKAIVSPQGEIFQLENPISLIKHRELILWLFELENEMRFSLSKKIMTAIDAIEEIFSNREVSDSDALQQFIYSNLGQVSLVAFQVFFALFVEDCFANNDLNAAQAFYARIIEKLVRIISRSPDLLHRHKIQALVVELIHHRDIIDLLINSDDRETIWVNKLRFYANKTETDYLEKLTIKVGRNEFSYGFEYYGVADKLAYTPLVDDCFLSMTQALSQKLGGCPFGPAGTGKTECIKSLGNIMGRMVLVFNCDESFDYQSMGRILLGLAKVGSWGCFDEFNRLETKSLSAISSQISNIERGLKNLSEKIEVSGKWINVHPDTGIFVTMNPGYVGRNELPENLKKQFREFSMQNPEKQIIVDVILASQCFVNSKLLSEALTPFFDELADSVSNQPHYDFGLRAIKSILSRCGNSRRNKLDELDEGNESEFEMMILVECLKDTIVPKLVKHDEEIFNDLLFKHFHNVIPRATDQSQFVKDLLQFAEMNGIVADSTFVAKALQILQIQENHHGFMLVGESGSGKTTIYKLALNALSTSINGFDLYTIDSKVMTKEELYGVLDPITRDWTDGLFTKILRNVVANLRGEQNKPVWIVFDGDIDPDWAENLNSVLDDNKILTLPNGERIEMTPNIRIVFEVDSLEYTTLATISRCGMIWFDRSLVPIDSLWNSQLFKFTKTAQSLLESVDDVFIREEKRTIMNKVVDFVKDISSDLVLAEIVKAASGISHIMNFDEQRCLDSFFSFFTSHLSNVLREKDKDPSVNFGDLKSFTSKAMAQSLVWAFAGDSTYDDKQIFAQFVLSRTAFSGLNLLENILEQRLSIPDFEWVPWSASVEAVDLEPHQVLDASTVVPTVDTVIHESLIHGIINKHSALILCGPPGSGKTMTLLKALRNSPNLDVIPLNFSKDTTPSTVLSALQQHCEYRKTNHGLKLTPKVTGKWVVVFCDEINLPSADKYGTQRVNSFIRQMIEHSGFWRPQDQTWVTIENIQFVGACNDPNDPGRHKLANRFMRHVTLIMVDNPGPSSLKQIYQTFNSASLKCSPDLRLFKDSLTDAMLEIYHANRKQFTSAKKAHYVYSPRELTRWSRGILEALRSVSYSELSDLIRLWYHEGLRLFYDRLANEDDQKWCKETFWSIGAKCFPNVGLEVPFKEPVLFSTWLTSDYESVEEKELRNFVRERLRIFSEEEMDINLVLFEDLLDHALRIDRVLRQHQGHMILVGPSTSGKNTLTRFVAWINGLNVVQLRVRTGYTISDFEDSLRSLLLACAKGEKTCFLIDESCILETSFIERMNSLLANSEVPGLFSGDNLKEMLAICRTESSAQGMLLDSDDELYSWFTTQISENLHVIFTISNLDGSNKPQVNSSPALFNRCVLSWMGDWSNRSLVEVATSIVVGVALDLSSYEVPESLSSTTSLKVSNFREAVVDSLVFIHRSGIRVGRETYPNEFIKFVQMFVSLFEKGQSELEENQRYTNIGLDKLRETVLQVSQMKKVLSEKKEILLVKDEDAKKMLNKMIVGQNEAERKREFSVDTQVALEKQEIEINSRRAKVMEDLELAEPAVLEAQRGVQNIKKLHLTEMRSMSNPPAAVKLAMESVCILLGYEVSSWRDVQLIIRKDDFITSIVSYDNETCLTSEMRRYMEEVYLSRPDFNYETINRASKACGPLLQWVIAQLKYSTILEEIGPLRQEVMVLEASATKSKAKLIAIAEMIKELEERILSYKHDYTELIRETEKIKLEIENIEKKVERSLALIENLTRERQRWQASIKEFESGREKIIGNSILGAAFCLFCGDLDQNQRNLLTNEWKDKLRKSSIMFDETVSGTSLLSAISIAKWTSYGLPKDELFIDNFGIMEHSKNPFIIDPSGDIVEVIIKKSSSKKVIISSFLEDSFVKVLEDAMRFGGTILIQNAEAYNPILDSVLRGNFVQNGGRKSLQLGSKLVEILNDFSLILYTRDAHTSIPSFVSSRCTILNFSVTIGNLQNQVLNISLQHSRPELFKKRVELISLQGDYQIRLLGLRKLLLMVLNDVSGTILDSDEIIESLEQLESESSEISERIGESEEVMFEVDKTRNEHSELACHSKAIYRILTILSEWNKFYNFSLATYIGIFKKVLNDGDGLSHLGSFVSKLYHEIFALISPTLKRLDRIVFAVALSIAYHDIETSAQTTVVIKEILKQYGVNESHRMDALELLKLSVAQPVEGDIVDNWSLLVEVNKENRVFTAVSSFIAHLIGASEKATLMDVYDEFVSPVLNVGVESDNVYGIKDLVQMGPSTIIISTTEGFDVTFKVLQAAKAMNKDVRVFSMGSKEGVELVNKEIEKGASTGNWLVVQNIQMASHWLPKLQRKIESLSPDSSFRLFLTCSLKSDDIPNGLITSSHVITYESLQSFRTTLMETFESLVMLHEANAFKHVIFLLSWYHAMIRERLKFVPGSFSKFYDFNETDVSAAALFVKRLFEESPRAHSNPKLVAWKEIGYMVGKIVYGGKISDTADARYCVALSEYLFSDQVFQADFNLIWGGGEKEEVKMPDCLGVEPYKQWIMDLPETAPLSWLGLEESVDIKNKQAQAQEIAEKLVEI